MKSIHYLNVSLMEEKGRPFNAPRSSKCNNGLLNRIRTHRAPHSIPVGNLAGSACRIPAEIHMGRLGLRYGFGPDTHSAGSVPGRLLGFTPNGALGGVLTTWSDGTICSAEL